MKNLILITLLFVSLQVSAIVPALEKGNAIPAFELVDLSNQEEVITEKDLIGKVTVIEFWATWCGPCVSSMKKMEALQKQFPEEVQVWVIGHDSKERVQKFMNNKQIDVQFLHDESKVFDEWFPHRTIPHAIVINPKGEVQGITSPENISDGELLATYNNLDVVFPLKKENVDFDYFVDYFNVDTTIEQSFRITSAIPDVGAFSKQPPKGIFGGRRISAHNYTVDALYRLAYQTSTYRLIYEVDKDSFDYKNPQHKYCLDLIVSPTEKDQLFEQLKGKIAENCPYKARIEQRTMQVAVLSILPDSTVNMDQLTTIDNGYNAAGR
ncbi:MAG: TlpA disulfide reductase family protein [Bacteroidota bacterium]